MSGGKDTGVQTDTDGVVFREEGRGGRKRLQVEEQLRLRYLERQRCENVVVRVCLNCAASENDLNFQDSVYPI